MKVLQNNGYLSRWIGWVCVWSVCCWLGCSDYLGSGNSEPNHQQGREVVGLEQAPSEEKPTNGVEPKPEPKAEPVVDAPSEAPPSENNGDASETVDDTGAPETPVEGQPESSSQVEVRSCAVSFKIAESQFRNVCDRDVPASITSVTLAGEFSQWKPNVALQPVGNGVWEGSLKAPAGHYAYKVVLNGQVWCVDPQNPMQKYDNDVANSLVQVPDCRVPELTLVSLKAPVQTGTMEADIKYWDSSDQKGFDASSLTVQMNGQPLTSGVQVKSDGTIQLRLSKLEPGRYSFWVDAKDKAGGAAKSLYFYAWVEDKKFSWEQSTLYFVFVDRFHNGDTANDAPLQNVGPIANYRGGDLQGIIDKLKSGYFKDLSVNALWLSPLYEHPNTPQKAPDNRLYAGYHGYWPTEPRKVAKRFGSNKLLTEMVREAHKQGIRVLMDLATNHVHTDHPYWKQNQNNGWFHSYNLCAPAWDKPIVCWFDPFLPDIDYRNFQAAKQMMDDAIWWAKTAELDGFRVDAVKHMRDIVMFNLRAQLKKEVTHGNYHFYLLGETFAGGWKSGGDLIKRYVNDRMLTGQFDFPVYWEIVGTLGRRESGATFKRMDQVIKESIDAKFYGSNSIMSRFIGNHDVPRFVSHADNRIESMWGGNRDKAWNSPPPQPTTAEPYDRIKIAWTLLFALPGVPLLYYGDEIGLAGEGDPDNRRVMPWTGLSDQQKSVLAHVQKVSGLRKQYPALRSEARQTLYVDDERYVFLRGTGAQRVLVVLRRGGSIANLSIPMSGVVADGTPLQDLMRNKTWTVSNGSLSISLQPNEATYLLIP